MLDPATTRILDASLNRAGEGLRVAEDYARFVLDDSFLTGQLKSLRHDLAEAASGLPSTDRHAARDTQRDVGTVISTEGEQQRGDVWDVCAASLKRTEQSLRSLEEYGKLFSADFAGRMESLRYRLYTVEKALDLTHSSRLRLSDVQLCVLVDGCDSPAAFERLIRELVDARVGMIQLRDKHLDDRDLIERARLLVTLARQSDAPPRLPPVSEPPLERTARSLQRPCAPPGHTLAIINDRPDIAAAVHAEGVHLGQEDLSVKHARAIVGTEMLIGVSTHNINQARAAVLDGANYLGAGPTFPSQTKTFDAFAGLDYLREVATEIRLPTFAIGGITAQNLPDVLATGITRVAVSGAVTTAPDTRAVTKKLLNLLSPASHSESPLAV